MKKYITFMTSALAVAVLLTTLIAAVASASGLQQPESKMFYVVMAHPDDEISSWPMISSRSDEYLVIVTLTRGEGTYSCIPHDHAVKEQSTENHIVEEGTLVEGFIGQTGFRTGAYRYQGPSSPVGEEDDAERHPFGDPWVGQGTTECARARIASWHWFLDDMFDLDGTDTSMEIGDDPWIDDDYRGNFCPPGHQGSGQGQPIEKQIGCADVWADANGARVTFDLGNAAFDGSDWPDPLFGSEDITAALQTLRSNRSVWGLPELPESGMLAASHYYQGDDPACSSLLFYDHPEHGLVQETLRFVDQGAGPQYGISSCPTDDKYLEGAELEVVPQDWSKVILMNFLDPVTENRVGPVLVDYGWLWDTYTFQAGTGTYWRAFD